jgi:hypothetical protein
MEFMFDYHDRYGFLGRHWVEAETIEEAKEKAKNICAITGWELMEGTVKECKKSGAVKAQTDELFEQHARSFIGDSE